MPERLLLVEDEAHLAEVIADNLEVEGYSVEVVGDGEKALERVRAAEPALVLLDVMLPGIDGFTVCERLRAEGNEVPILFLTARNASDDRVRGLELGGDDYLGKPFDLRELILRVRAILRRAQWLREPPLAGNRLVLGEAVIDFATYTARIGGRETKLSTKETLILRTSLHNRSEIEWGAHQRFGREKGMSVEHIRGILAGPEAPRWDNTDAALLRAADELQRDLVIATETWNRLATRYDTRQLMDVVFTIGGYRFLAMAQNAVGLQANQPAAIPPVWLEPDHRLLRTR